MRLRRRQHCFIEINDQAAIDFAAFFRGEVRWQASANIALLCPFLAQPIALDADDLRIVAMCPSERWLEMDELIHATGASERRLRSLVERNALFSDCASDDGMQRREQAASRMGWDPLALLYHRMTRWSGVAGTEATREHSAPAERARLQAHVTRYGRPPEAFVRQPHAQGTEFLAAPRTDQLGALLERRFTTRAFDQSRALDRDALAQVLFAAFGAFGTRRLPNSLLALKKASPSGGGLHPIEAYVLVAKVAGLASGLYHYRTDIHALDSLLALSETAVREKMCTAAAGQAYFAEAHVAVLHVARFERHFWKYVEHHKAYKAVLMDSAHISQTLYLASTALDLGAYYTAAINDADVDEWLGLDGIRESCLAMSGFGYPDPHRSELHFIPEPYDPTQARRTQA
jgi:putative peptide maturation dehydrogenase